MEVILIKDVSSLGKIGQVVKVKDGYARNYLLPRQHAYVATAANLKKIEQQEKNRKIQFAKEKAEADEYAEKLKKASITVNVEVNDLDKLYGSITETEIIQALAVEGFKIEKKQIIIEQAIEELGIFDVGIKIHPEVIAKIRLWVTKK